MCWVVLEICFGLTPIFNAAMGTILAVILAITWDFRHVTLAALAIYVAGVGAILWAHAGRTAAR